MKNSCDNLTSFWTHGAVLICSVCCGLSSYSTYGQVFSNVFDHDSGQNTYIQGLLVYSTTGQPIRQTGFGDGNWISSFQGVTPNGGSQFLASANGNFDIDFVGFGLTKVLGGSIEAHPYSVSFYVTTYYAGLSGIPFSDFDTLRLGGMGGTMQWENTPTPVEDTVWVKWSGIYTPSLSDVGTPFVFHALWNERARAAIAIDGSMMAQPIPEPPTSSVLLIAGAFWIVIHRKWAK